MTRIFYYAWEKPACCVSKISSDCGCQSKETGVGMEVRLLSVGARGFFSSLRDSPSRLRRSILSLPTRKNTSGTQGKCTVECSRLFMTKQLNSVLILGVALQIRRIVSFGLGTDNFFLVTAALKQVQYLYPATQPEN